MRLCCFMHMVELPARRLATKLIGDRLGPASRRGEVGALLSQQVELMPLVEFKVIENPDFPKVFYIFYELFQLCFNIVNYASKLFKALRLPNSFHCGPILKVVNRFYCFEEKKIDYALLLFLFNHTRCLSISLSLFAFLSFSLSLSFCPSFSLSVFLSVFLSLP